MCIGACSGQSHCMAQHLKTQADMCCLMQLLGSKLRSSVEAIAALNC